MAEIHRAAFPAAQAWSADVMVLQLGLSGGFGFVHSAGGMVLARIAADEAEILTIAVAPAAQSRGLGRDLLQTAMDEAARRGAAAMFLEVGVSNEPARALYKAAGFRRVGRRRAYYIGGGDALILRASLSPPDIDRPGAAPAG
jgi:ribosomal-protein-alanine N-acetyltransferase